MYYCNYCNHRTEKISNHKRHLETDKHKLTRKSHEELIKEVRNQKLEFEPIPPVKAPPIISNKKQFMRNIIDMCKLFKLNKIDLNNYFLYDYYCQEFESLDNYDLMDFYEELTSLEPLLKKSNEPELMETKHFDENDFKDDSIDFSVPD